MTFLICHLSLAIPAPPQRIVSAIPSATEILFAIGAESQVIGVTLNCNYPPEAKKKEKVGGFDINLEKVASLKPDLVVMHSGAQAKDIEKLKKYGLPVYTMEPKTVDQVVSAIKRLGFAIGRADSAEAVAQSLQDRLAMVRTRFKPGLLSALRFWEKRPTRRQKALVIIGLKPLVVAGQNTFIDDILKSACVDNAAEATMGEFPQYSFEKLVSDDPDNLIITEGLINRKELVNDKQWQSLKAVRGNKIMFINPDIISRPGPRVVDAVEQIAEFAY